MSDDDCEAAFLLAISEGEDCETARLAYADWLDEQGRPLEAKDQRAVAPSARKSWIVRVRCTVTKDVVVDGCTEEQARKDPWEHAIDETETGQDDWEVLGVEPNE